MSEPTPRCFWDNLPASEAPLFLVDGLWLCALHAKCAWCDQPFMENVGEPKSLTCVCEDYLAVGHEDKAWCSMNCLEAAHMQGDLREVETETFND